SGLTTAAIVWGAAGIGVAIGAGFYIEAIVGVGLLLVSGELVPVLIFKFGFEKLKLKEIQIHLTLNERNKIEQVINQIQQIVVNMGDVTIKDTKEGSYIIEMLLMVHHKEKSVEVYNKLTKIKDVERIELSS